ncbi:MAG TPA: helix-turn-helix transcriptional regulator [Solirubrobacteraceae bacterium]|nr:helix-turn-helix transcriptional regulator [Solirubrobacteraceae bacterium]
MDAKGEIREFLTSRRASITPEQAGLTVYGDNRRVPGLRREEVAMLAGVSADYYTQVERGNVSGVSDSVLEALVRALRLDDVERSHLFNLIRARRTATQTRRRPRQRRVRASVQQVLDALTNAPAYVRNEYGELVATNTLGRALYSELFDGHDGPPNVARFVFLDPRATTFFVDWDEVANQIVAATHAQAGRAPYDRRLTDLIGELSTRSEVFRVRWAAHNVRHHDTGVKRFHHPVVGALELNYDALPLPADPGLTLVTYTAPACSRSAETLALLGSWATTTEPGAASDRPQRRD